MTNGEAIEWLEAIRKKYIHGGDEEFDMKRNEALDLAISALSRDRWISVEERLPEKDGHYLASDGASVYEAAFIGCGKTKWYDPVEEWDTYTVTHWMPLPEPPKEET